MSGQKNSTEEKFKNISLINEAKVDKLNQLSEQTLASDILKSRKQANQANTLAKKINYNLGEATSLLNRGNSFLNQREFDEAGKAYVAAKNIFSKSKDAKGLGLVNHKLGNLNYFLGNYKTAIKLYEKSLKYKLQTGDEHSAGVLYSNLGVIYAFINDYVAAMHSLYKGKEIFEKLEDNLWIGNIFLNMGKNYVDLNDHDEAIKAYQKALSINLKLNNQKTISEIRNNIGVAFFCIGELEKAKTEHLKALEYRESVNDVINVAYSMSNLGDVFKAKKKYKIANKYYYDALKIFENLHDKGGLASIYFNIGELKSFERSFESAKDYLKSSIELSRSLGLKEVLMSSYGLLSSISSELKEYKLAYDFILKMNHIDKEISKVNKTKLIAQISSNAEIKRIEKQTEMERKKNEELRKAYDSLDLEKEKSEKLLLNILPKQVAEELKLSGKATAKLYEDVTILFSDFVEFSTVSEQLSPQELVDELHECFKAFDEIISKYNIEKIKTIGDAYMAVAGLPTSNKNHAQDIVMAAKEILEFMKKRRKKLGSKTFKIRIGVNSGEVVAGIVGIKKFVYDIWGDAVNIAARMEQNAEATSINISHSTFLKVKSKVDCIYRGEIEAKNKGRLKMYFVKI
jgi:class 3 adenylate cyclase/predicted negative regulator of RcsB-dependent stress response